ncbi:MAG: hypothetical protein LBS88_12230 [Tannerellaceae bacterium]|nr:hypothetical protein [Tannerellaceae bacterium]
MHSKLSQISVIARYEAIHFRRHCEVRSNPLPPSLRDTKQSTSAVIARYEAIHFRRHCEVRSNPGCPVWIASPSGFARTARNDDFEIHPYSSRNPGRCRWV